MSRKIIIENISSGYLTIDIANAFANSGLYDEVILFAGQVNVRPTKPNEHVKVKRTVNYNAKNVYTRLFSCAVAFLHFMFYTAFKSRKYELFLVSTIPFITFLPGLKKRKYSLLIYDVHPDSMIGSGIFSENSWIAKQWEKNNRKTFSHSQKVFAITKSMKQFLTKYVDENKIEVVYNWSHNEFLKSISKEDNIFIRNNGLQGNRIVLYSGAIGINLKPCFEALLSVAELLNGKCHVKFVIIGEGQVKQYITNVVKEKQLGNCIVLPFQPSEMLPYSMGAADIGFVALNSSMGDMYIPSKFNSYLAAGTGILCIQDQAVENTELSNLIKDNMLGKIFCINDIDAVANFIETLSKEEKLLQQYKSNARKLSFEYTPQNANKFVEALKN